MDIGSHDLGPLGSTVYKWLPGRTMATSQDPWNMAEHTLLEPGLGGLEKSPGPLFFCLGRTADYARSLTKANLRASACRAGPPVTPDMFCRTLSVQMSPTPLAPQPQLLTSSSFSSQNQVLGTGGLSPAHQASRTCHKWCPQNYGLIQVWIKSDAQHLYLTSGQQF